MTALARSVALRGRLLKNKRDNMKNDFNPCPKCHGQGKVWSDGQAHYAARAFMTIKCPECKGYGLVIAEAKTAVCKSCGDLIAYSSLNKKWQHFGEKKRRHMVVTIEKIGETK